MANQKGMIILKSPDEIALMRQAGRIVARALTELQAKARPGISTFELDAIAEDIISKNNALPTFKGYRGFPATITASINEELVHGIPRRDRILKEGDILSIDVGATYKGYVGDAAITFPIGEVPEQTQRLIEVTRGALTEGLSAARIGNRTGDISAAIQKYIEKNGFSVIREYTGHGVGQAMHEAPQIPNFGTKGRGVPLQNGMTVALEPMVSIGTWQTRVLDDEWTVVTADGKLSAHFEHSIAIQDGIAEILTIL